MIFKGQLDSKEKIDSFIDDHNDLQLKFSTLTACNDFAKNHQEVDFLDNLPAEKVILFDEIEGLIYRNYIIKRYDRLINPSSHQSYKCHVDGEISNTWDRNLLTLGKNKL